MIKLVHNKKLFWVIIALIILLIIVIVLIQVKEAEKKISECLQDDDCVKASCCHAKSCTSIDKAPDCSNILCTQVCEPGTLDCGGSCKCINGKCSGLAA